jgi:hypothetical protein
MYYVFQRNFKLKICYCVFLLAFLVGPRNFSAWITRPLSILKEE